MIEKCRAIINIKFNAINKFNKTSDKEERILELCNNETDVLSSYIQSLLGKLWENPKLIASIIEKTDFNDLKEHLAPFFANNFYENILSTDCIDDNLMYILTLLLQSEINNLKDINQKDKFLNNTPCGIMFEEIYKKIEVQNYLNKITKNAIENLDKENQLYYDLNKIVEELNNEIPNEMNEDKKRSEDFNKKYLSNLDISHMDKLIEENKNNQNMYGFLNSKISIFSKKGEHKFSNKNFLSFCYGNKNSDKLINLYKNKFYIAIDFIEQITKDILNEINSIPNSIKKLLRIISELVKQKFPNINAIDRNYFISKFFFDKLIIPFLTTPNIYYYKSDITLNNLKLICNILQKYVNGDFFISNDSEYCLTPFNLYIIYNIENIVNLFQNLTNVDLSADLENLVNNKLPPDYEYNYFNENPDKDANVQSILYNIYQIKSLVKTIDNNKKTLFIDDTYKTIKIFVEKLMREHNMNLIENIIKEEKDNYDKYHQKIKNKKDKKKEDELPKPKMLYFLFFKLIINKKYGNYLNIYPEKPFYKTQKKESKESKEEIDIIKFKNNLIFLLNNYKKLEKKDFNGNEINSTEKILNKIICFLSNLESEDNDFTIFSAEYLLDSIKKLPENKRENYLENIFNEVEKDINESIQQIDFNIFASIKGNLKFHNKYEDMIKKYYEIQEEYEKNKIIMKIVKEYFIPIDFKFYYENEYNNWFEIKASQFKEKEKEKADKIKKYENSNKVKLCFYINDFIKAFPDFNNYKTKDDVDILEIQEKLKVHEQIDKYINIIKEKLKIYKEINIPDIIVKIKDYILEKIYDKLFPKKPNKLEKDFLKKCISLNWIQICHMSSKNVDISYISPNAEKNICDDIKLFVQDKSIRNKLMVFNKIYYSINLLLKFNKLSKKDYDFGIDDILPLLYYFIIKAHPLLLWSNIKFLEIYKRELKNKYQGNQFLDWRLICEFIPEMNYSNFKDITPEEFEKRCSELLK